MGHPAEPLSESPRPARSPISPRLVSLAILKENWNQGQTYLDNFLPFVCDCLRGAVGPVTVADVQQALRKRFSMTIPQAVVETLLKRTAKRGMSVRRDGTYEPDFDKLADTILTSKRDELLRCYSALIAQLRTFADERYGRVLTAGQAEDALNAYVSEFGAQTLLEGVAAREFEPTVVALAKQRPPVRSRLAPSAPWAMRQEGEMGRIEPAGTRTLTRFAACSINPRGQISSPASLPTPGGQRPSSAAHSSCHSSSSGK